MDFVGDKKRRPVRRRTSECWFFVGRDFLRTFSAVFNATLLRMLHAAVCVVRATVRLVMAVWWCRRQAGTGIALRKIRLD